MNKLVLILGVFLVVSCQSGNKSNDTKDVSEVKMAMVEDTLNISGMHCDMCVQSIEKGVNELEGISFVKAVLEDSSAIVKYDASMTNLAQIEKAVEKRGYKVKGDL